MHTGVSSIASRAITTAIRLTFGKPDWKGPAFNSRKPGTIIPPPPCRLLSGDITLGCPPSLLTHSPGGGSWFPNPGTWRLHKLTFSATMIPRPARMVYAHSTLRVEKDERTSVRQFNLPPICFIIMFLEVATPGSPLEITVSEQRSRWPKPGGAYNKGIDITAVNSVITIYIPVTRSIFI